MRFLGNFSTTQTVAFLWNTQAASGASVTRATNGTIRVYKNNSATQRASSSGITDTEDFDSVTGIHLCAIDLSDGADAGFYTLGSYQVVLEGSTIDGRSVSAVLAHFNITESGGGVTPPGTNPPTGTIPATFPLLFLELKAHSGTTAYAETALNDRVTWWHGRKAPKILKVSTIRRALSKEGGFEASTWRVELEDSDRSFRTLAASEPLGGRYCALYVVDDTTRRIEGEPFRIAAGLVAEYRALPGLHYELVIEDALGNRFADAFRQPKIPPHRLTADEYLTNPDLEGKAGPLAFGALTDEGTSSPSGVVPALFIGSVNLTTLHSLAVNTVVDAYLFCEHAVQNIQNLYYNEPTSLTAGSPRHPVTGWSLRLDSGRSV